jgi:hypothetical protein
MATWESPDGLGGGSNGNQLEVSGVRGANSEASPHALFPFRPFPFRPFLISP